MHSSPNVTYIYTCNCCVRMTVFLSQLYVRTCIYVCIELEYWSIFRRDGWLRFDQTVYQFMVSVCLTYGSHRCVTYYAVLRSQYFNSCVFVCRNVVGTRQNGRLRRCHGVVNVCGIKPCCVIFIHFCCCCFIFLLIFLMNWKIFFDSILVSIST